MRTIYLVRHGQTLFNVHHKIQGTCDSPLTELGIAQAQEVRKYFSNRQIHFDAAFCSTQERASDTLEIITNHHLHYLRLKNLHEKSHGDYEGQDEFMLPWRRGFSRTNPAMESDLHVAKRMNKAITEILDHTHRNDQVLVVGHGTALRLFTQELNPDFSQFDNCGIVKIIAKDDQLQFAGYRSPAKELTQARINQQCLLRVR